MKTVDQASICRDQRLKTVEQASICPLQWLRSSDRAAIQHKLKFDVALPSASAVVHVLFARRDKMSAPAQSAAVDAFFEALEYSSTLIEVDPETKDLKTILTAPAETVTKAVADRTVAERGVNKATAMRDYTYRVMGKSIDGYERKASAEFETGEKDAGYQRLFPITPSALARTNIEDRAKVYGGFISEAQSEETPKPLDKVVKTVVSGWTTYQGAAKKQDTAVAQLGKAREKQEAAKTGVIVAFRKLEGKLTDRFAEDAKRVRGYFAPSKPAKKPAAKTGADKKEN